MSHIGQKPSLTPSHPLLHAVAERMANTTLGTWFLVHVGTHVDRFLLARTSGRVALSSIATRNLLLRTTGAISGKPRSAPLLYLKVGDSFCVVASNGGSTRFPAWFHNLRADPSAEVTAEGREIRVVAREAGGVEYDRLWKGVNEIYRGYDDYRKKASSRHIPLVILEPQEHFND